MKRAIIGLTSLLFVAGCATPPLEKPIGRVFLDRSGHLETSAVDHHPVLNFDGQTAAEAERIAVEPGPCLAMMQKANADAGQDLTFRVTGVVTAKHTLDVYKAVAMNTAAVSGQR